MSTRRRDANPSLDDSLTNMQWLCSLDSNPLVENAQTTTTPAEATSMNPYPKPPFSYATLILLAINSTAEKRMTLQDIYKWIEDNFPYYKHCKKAWKNSIRHNLSLHSFFLKAKRPSSLPGKGSYWSISPEGKENIMKEVLKHQQPHIWQNLIVEQSAAKGLRPILPKPADNLLIASRYLNKRASSGVEIMTDGSVNGLPSSIPVVILPTQVYMNMANKIAAQAAAGNMTAVGVNPTFVPMATDSPNVEESAEALQGFEELNQETVCSLLGKAAGDEVSEYSTSLAQIVDEATQKNEKIQQALHNVENTEIETISEVCATDAGASINCITNCNNLPSKDVKNENNEMLAPCIKKTRTDKRKTKPVNRKTSTPSIQKKQHLPQPKRSPLRPRPQPTLAAINSQSNESMMSPGCIFNRHSVSDLSNFSPVKPMITPTKACSNQSFLSSLLVSPLAGSSNLGYSGFTPLKFGSDSGIFTPSRDGEMDFGFLFSPERFGSSKACSTPQSCRKSLGLGLSSRAEEKKTDSGYNSYDADFSKL